MSIPTFILQVQLHVEDCDHLAFPLAYINVPVHGCEFRDLGRDPILFRRALCNFFCQIVFGPWCSVLIHPVPIIRVVEDHLVRMGEGSSERLSTGEDLAQEKSVKGNRVARREYS